MNRNGYVVNKTTIFNYVMMQPGYYFQGTTLSYNNLGIIKNSALQNKLYDRNVSVIGGSRVTGAAKIGYKMEINSNVEQQTYNDRYWEYINQFSALKSYPCVFYAGNRDSICGTSWGA